MTRTLPSRESSSRLRCHQTCDGKPQCQLCHGDLAPAALCFSPVFITHRSRFVLSPSMGLPSSLWEMGLVAPDRMFRFVPISGSDPGPDGTGRQGEGDSWATMFYGYPEAPWRRGAVAPWRRARRRRQWPVTRPCRRRGDARRGRRRIDRTAGSTGKGKRALMVSIGDKRRVVTQGFTKVLEMPRARRDCSRAEARSSLRDRQRQSAPASNRAQSRVGLSNSLGLWVGSFESTHRPIGRNVWHFSCNFLRFARPERFELPTLRFEA